MDNAEECPNPTCKGTLDDAWAWGEALLSEHPDRPEAPEVVERFEVYTTSLKPAGET